DLNPNRLVFQIQPYQGIELRFQAKVPGPTLSLQKVDMHFEYGDAFKASRYTGYEVMLYSCSHGDATLFSRSDLVTAAWEIGQPAYLICRGEVEVLDGAGAVVATLSDGNVFGETALLLPTPRTATVRAKVDSNFYVLGRTDLLRILHDYPHFFQVMQKVAKE